MLELLIALIVLGTALSIRPYLMRKYYGYKIKRLEKAIKKEQDAQPKAIDPSNDTWESLLREYETLYFASAEPDQIQVLREKMHRIMLRAKDLRRLEDEK